MKLNNIKKTTKAEWTTNDLNWIQKDFRSELDEN